MTPADDIHESNARFHEAWCFFARKSTTGEVLDLPEVSIASSNVPWAMLNAAFLRAPVDTEAALKRAASAAFDYFAPRGRGWMFALCEDWLPRALRSRVTTLLAPLELRPSVMATGMVAERLLPAARPLPRLKVLATRDGHGRADLADINSLSYDVEPSTGRLVFDVPELFTSEHLGFVGYRLDQPATCASVIRVEDVAYMTMVATLPPHRQVGCAEAIMRHALAEAQGAWGLERTVLHATPAGVPVYRRMGYRPVTRFLFYTAEPRPALRDAPA
ncbi:MAG: GNAT family N-acetyltransferase [Cystobacter sp.]